MTNVVIAAAAALSEFVGLPQHQYGDCGPDATLMALHAIAPQKWSLTPAGLYNIDHAEEIARYAESNGAQNIEHMDAYLTHVGVPHTTYGYSTPDVVDRLHTQLKQYILAHSPDPVIVEYALAGAGFPDDESGVHFHFNMFAGENDETPNGEYIGGYWRGDGDSRTDASTGATTHLVLTPWPEIAAAEPIAYIIVHQDADRIVHGPRIVV